MATEDGNRGVGNEQANHRDIAASATRTVPQLAIALHGEVTRNQEVSRGCGPLDKGVNERAAAELPMALGDLGAALLLYVPKDKGFGQLVGILEGVP